jgi:tungstate transport system permease protein
VVLLLNSLIALVRRWREKLDDPLPDIASPQASGLAAQGAQP